MLCLCELPFRIICVDSRSRYLYIVLGGYLRNLGAHSVQSSCTLWIYASYSVFVYGIYSKSRIVCVFVGPGVVSTSPTFMRSSASHPAGPDGRLTQKRENRAPIARGGRFRHNFHSSLYPL